MKTATADDLPRVSNEELAERAIVTAMTVNPLVAMDSSQLLAAAGRVAARALMRPAVFGRRTVGLGRELGEILIGLSGRAPDSSDRRFSDPTFRDNPLYRRLMQSYLAWREAVLGLADELDLDVKSRERGKFALSLVTEALAPTNSVLGNPAALKRAFETGGASLFAGLRYWVTDLIENGGLPSQVDKRPFRVGENLAATAGQVVFRNEVIELIQYKPLAANVHERPLVFVPPQVNKYYVLDLAPGRSLVEYMLQQGFQGFMVSWRNPTPAQREWNLETYVRALIEATDAVREITASPTINVLGACAGGITTSVFLAHLAAHDDERVSSATFPVTVLDMSVPMAVGMLASEKTVASSIQRSRKKGVLAGRDMARIFALLRPNDLVWNYWVNNYLLGAEPAPFDVLAWNNDATNLPAALHAEFLDLFVKNRLVGHGALEVADTAIDLARVKCDVYAIGALTDHITPWNACYRTPQLFGGKRTFVASSSGHIQALVNPPGNLKSRFYTNDAEGLEAKDWLAGAKEHKGTWWKHWAEWLGKRSGSEKAAPAELGSAAHPPLTAAPGRYVHQKA